MQRRRWVLGAVGGALAVLSVAYLIVRDSGGGGDDVRAGGATSSSTTKVTSSSTTVTTLAATTTVASTTTPQNASTVVPTTSPAPPFESSVGAVTVDQLGASWHSGCPVPAEKLRAVDVSHWGYDGAVRRGRLVVHVDQADRIVNVFRAIYAARFPIERMTPIDAYGGDDQASMRANNTSGFNCRYVSGTQKWSEHAFGRAIDVNPLVNPYVKGSTVDPPEGAPYADRSRSDAGMIRAGDAVVRAFSAQGWGWGGSWSGGKDYQHFSASGR